MGKLTRSQKITYTVIEGTDVLAQGHETARQLWNYTWWCCIGYNEKLRRERGDSWERFKRNQSYNRGGEGYPGRFTLEKELKDHWAAKDLSDRCFGYTIKDFDIAIRSWFSNLKSNPDMRPPKYCKKSRILTFDTSPGRNAKSLGNWVYRLTVLGGHIPDRHAIVKLHIQPGIKMRDIKLIRLQSDGTGVVVDQVEQEEFPGDSVAAIDLGIINIATIAFQSGKSILVSGKGLLAANQWANKQSSRCKPKNWEKGKQESRQSEKFKTYRKKAGNVRNLATHNLTRFIINECLERNVGTIVIGDLTGIREDADHGKAGNQKLHSWPFAEIRRQLEYKAEEVGIKVVARSERGTSKHHHLTGEKGVRSPRGLSTFKEAGQVINSDINGAFGILNNYLAEIGQVKVSPVPIRVGVAANLPGPPSTGLTQGIGKVQSFIKVEPTIVGRFDDKWSIVQTCCNQVIHLGGL